MADHAPNILSRTRLRTKLLLSYGLVIGIAVAAFSVTSRLVAGPGSFAARSLTTTAAVSRYTDQVDHRLGRALLLGIGLSLLTSVAAAAFITRLIVRPLDEVRAAARHMTDGHYDTRVPIPPSPDLAGIATDLNALAARLDTTERRRARLVSDLAHELSTPLTILRGQLDGFAEGIFAPSIALVSSMREELVRLERLTADLSQLSRAEETVFDLRLETLDVRALTARVVERLQPAYHDGAVGLAMTPGGPVCADADADRISQVMVNLLTNALAATDADGRVAVAVHRSGPNVTVRVTDTGCGIAKGDLQRVFERFERLTVPGRPEPPRGSGIGLTIARSIARAHGGDLRADSDGPGTGTSFTLLLPVDGPPTATSQDRR